MKTDAEIALSFACKDIERMLAAARGTPINEVHILRLEQDFMRRAARSGKSSGFAEQRSEKQ